MELKGLCHICGKIAEKVCRICGRATCVTHLKRGVCESCLSGAK